jgi:hypothetical protein
VGKTALLDYLAEQASGCRVAHAAGVESEMELVYAGLHQLLTPMLDRLERLPAPQANALRTAFGLSLDISRSAPRSLLTCDDGRESPHHLVIALLEGSACIVAGHRR